MTVERSDESYRSEWLLGVGEGFSTPVDVFVTALSDESGALMCLPVNQILDAQPGAVSETRLRIERFGWLKRLVRSGERGNGGVAVNVGWLASGGVGRMARWVDISNDFVFTESEQRSYKSEIVYGVGMPA